MKVRYIFQVLIILSILVRSQANKKSKKLEKIKQRKKNKRQKRIKNNGGKKKKKNRGAHRNKVNGKKKRSDQISSGETFLDVNPLPPSTTKILTFGDDMTVGSNAPGGFRIGLYSELKYLGYNVDMLGTKETNPSNIIDFDPHHEGREGKKP